MNHEGTKKYILFSLAKDISHHMHTIRPVILGQFGPPTLACIRSWGRQGFRVGMICVQDPGTPAPRSRHLSQSVRLPQNLLHTDEGISVVSRFLLDFQAHGLICINEATACWLQENRTQLPLKTALWLPSQKTIRDVLSKEDQIRAALESGLPVLPTYLISTPDFKPTSIHARHFPLCLRPSGIIRPYFKVQLVSSPAALLSVLQGLEQLQGTIIAQPFKNMPNLVIHGIGTLDHEVLGIQAFLVERKFEGVTLTIRPWEISEKFRAQCTTFARNMHLVGPFHLEFLHDPNSGASYFLEVNNRLGGTTAKVLACGYDEPLLALAAYGAVPLPDMSMKSVTATNRLALLKCLLHAMTGRLSALDSSQEQMIVRLGRTLRAMAFFRDDVISFEDYSGSLGLYWSSISRVFKTGHS